HVRFAAAECGAEHRRLQKSFEPRRVEPKHDLAERDHLGHQAVPLAALTLATMRLALAAIGAKFFAASAFVSSSAEPTPTAAAPARSQSPTLSIDTPPVGISFTCGSGPWMSLR